MAAPFHSHGPHIKAVETTSMFGKQREGAKLKLEGQNCLISVRKSAVGGGTRFANPCLILLFSKEVPRAACKLVAIGRWADVNLKFFLTSLPLPVLAPNL